MSFLSTLRRMLEAAEKTAEDEHSAARAVDESRLRGDAEAILRAAVEAGDAEALVAGTLRELAPSIPAETRIHVAGFGLAAASMARGAELVLGSRMGEGVLIVPPWSRADAPSRFDTFAGGTPVPDQACVAGARAIRQLAQGLTADDTLLCLVSGGGSSLLTVPPEGLPLEEIQQLTRLLVERGATRRELNMVRRHLDMLKGGRLALEAVPARVVALVLSDLAGDPLHQIASGPLSPDRGRPADAVAVLRQYGLWKQAPLAVRGWLDRAVCGEIEPAPGRRAACFDYVQVHVVGNGHTAARAACAAAERRGYEAQVLTAALGGEARKAGAFLAAAARSLARSRQPGGPPLCLIAAGDTDPADKDQGTSGPNQELALAATLDLQSMAPALVAAMNTSGADGTTTAAGAIATGATLRRADSVGLDARDTVRHGSANGLFSTLDDLIVSGPTGTAVGDIRIVLLP
jgi:hydroxypyruvate reductase